MVTLDDGGNVAVTRSVSDGNRILTLTPLSPLATSTLHTITIGAVKDLAGNPLGAAPVLSQFTTGAGVDLIPPAVASLSPANGTVNVPVDTTIQIQFNEPLRVATFTSSSVFVDRKFGGPLPPMTLSFSVDGLTVILTPDVPLDPNIDYRVTLLNSQGTTANQDLSGNTYAGGRILGEFKTAP